MLGFFEPVIKRIIDLLDQQMKLANKATGSQSINVRANIFDPELGKTNVVIANHPCRRIWRFTSSE